jgi:hypothetical protein
MLGRRVPGRYLLGLPEKVTEKGRPLSIMFIQPKFPASEHLVQHTMPVEELPSEPNGRS